MTGTNFYFDNYAMADFGLIMCDPENEQTFVSRSLITTDQSAKRSSKVVYDVEYEDTLTINLFVCKNPDIYTAQSERRFTDNDIREIRSWLESAKHPKQLLIEDDTQDGENEILCYYGIFSEVLPFIVNTECYGLYLTFKCSAPHGYSIPIKRVIQIGTSTSKKCNYICSSDDRESYTYPIVKVYLNTNISQKGKLKIKNENDGNKEMEFELPNESYIVINTKTKQVFNPNNELISLSELGWNSSEIFDYSSVNTGSFKLYWLRFLSGVNTLVFNTTVSNSVSKIEIISQFIRKVDGF